MSLLTKTYFGWILVLKVSIWYTEWRLFDLCWESICICSFINKKVVALFLLILCGFIIGANKFIFDKHEHVDMKNVKYVLTLSKDSADRGACLVFISKEDKTLKTLKYDGCSTLSINKDNGEFVIHSHKRNEHYRFTKEGKFKPF